MTEARDKPTVGFWATVVVVALVILYPLSFGPACWINQRTGVGASAIPMIYWPIARQTDRKFGEWSCRRTAVPELIVWNARLGINGDQWPYGRDELGWTLWRGQSTW
ncbi:MAG: hypothetical protein ACT4QC_05305 [Planctomycetaceae bacterium]